MVGDVIVAMSLVRLIDVSEIPKLAAVEPRLSEAPVFW